MPATTKKRHVPNPMHHTSMWLTATDQHGLIHLVQLQCTFRHSRWVSIYVSTGCHPAASHWEGEHPMPALPAMTHGVMQYTRYNAYNALVTCMVCETMRLSRP